MSKDDEPKWEVVDSIPGERPSKPPPPKRPNPLKSKKLWIGVALGVVAAILFPPLLVKLGILLRNPVSLILIVLAIFYYWMRARRPRRGP